MRLYLSSFRIGNEPRALHEVLEGGKRVAVIANADDLRSPKERANSYQIELDAFTSLGLLASELDLRNYFGKSEELQHFLRSFDMVWARGGNAFVLRRAFRQSGLDGILPKMIFEGQLAYGGYSAGAAMATPSLRGIEIVDDPSRIPEGYESTPPVWECLNLIPFSILPHYKSDHPESHAIEGCVSYLIESHLPFVALRDGEAIVYKGGQPQVVGWPHPLET